MSVRGVARVGFIPQARDEVQSLTPRMQAVKKLLIETDLSIPAIAREVGITTGTAKVYTHKIYEVEFATHGRITLMLREIARLRDQVQTLTQQQLNGAG